MWKQRILGDRITIKCYECSGSTVNADTATWNLERLIHLVESGKNIQAWSLPDRMSQKPQAGSWHLLSLTVSSHLETVTDTARWSNDDMRTASPESLDSLMSSLKVTPPSKVVF